MSLFDAFAEAHRTEGQREGRIYGFVIGKITDTRDPKGLGRVKARMAHQGQNESSDWLLPLWPGAIEGIANKDDEIVIGFVYGDPHLGFFALHPTSNTQSRPTEAMVLGTTAVAMWNNLTAQFNQLRTDFNTHIGKYNAHKHTGVTAGVGTSAVADTLSTATSATAAQKGKAADGSEVAAKTTSEIVLSGRAKVGK